MAWLPVGLSVVSCWHFCIWTNVKRLQLMMPSASLCIDCKHPTYLCWVSLWCAFLTLSFGVLVWMASLQGPQWLSNAEFCQLFPFHLVIDRKMFIRQMGDGLKHLMPRNLRSRPISLPSVIIMERPGLSLTFETILRHVQSVFVLKMRTAANGCSPVRLKVQYLKYMTKLSPMTRSLSTRCCSCNVYFKEKQLPVIQVWLTYCGAWVPVRIC